MSESPNPTSASTQNLACPDCGREFTRRGLAPHRRMCHPESALPSPARPAQPAVDPNVISAIAQALGTLTRTVERLDANLGRVLDTHTRSLVPPASPSEAASQAATAMRNSLERNLDTVLNEVARVRYELERQLTAWGGTATNDAQRAEEQALHQALGRLRRQQAEILFRLTQMGPDGVPNDLCLI